MDDELDTKRTHVLFCEECGCDSDVLASGWQGHVALEDDDTVRVAFFCPECLVEFWRDA